MDMRIHRFRPLVSFHLLIKVAFAAQNPTDVLCFDNKIFGDGRVLGCDFAGRVDAVGSNVSRLKKGDKVAGLIWGGEIKGLGAYSDYTIADENICFKIPDNTPLEQAATVPLAATTGWLALFRSQSLNIDRTLGLDAELLVWAGSTSVGLYAVQIASLFGFKVATVCSPRHFPLLHSLGAKYVFDYKDPEVTSSATASTAMREAGGILCTVRPSKEFTEHVSSRTKVTSILVFTSFLKEHQMGSCILPASEEDHQLATEFYQALPSLLSQGKIRPNTPWVIDQGLGGVNEGFQAFRDGKISGYKIVYKLN
ncbi:chaperonin 10-like protein [Ilyonectria sp. MPI-CAGE-AT-0026]|nr:chaperonin 10-like protein [Ilyonectria sp. MPI-CAGE-AT-0026]